MHEIVDWVMSSVKPPTPSETELRERVIGYLELISSAGKRDPDEMATPGVEYLRRIVDGPDARFTGC